MKIALGLSLILNVVLGVLYFQEKNQPPIERIILENSGFRVSKRVIVGKFDGPKVEKKAPHPKGALMVNTQDADTGRVAEEVSERVKNDRLEFLSVNLNLSQQDLDQVEKIKNQYYQKMQKVFPPQGGELSVDQRRRMLELEVERDQQLVSLMGKKGWEKFQKFRKRYNERQFEEQAGEFGVVVPLDI